MTAILTLALGIGAATAVFSVCDAMLWKPIPLPGIESLAMVNQRIPDDPQAFAYDTAADAADLRAQSQSFTATALFQQNLASIVTGNGEPERANVSFVSANFFDVLGVKPARGRAFQTGEDQPAAPATVVLSDAFWRTRFAADPAIVGKAVRVADNNATVIGVMPPNITFPLPSDFWSPLVLTPQQAGSRVAQVATLLGRLKPGVTLAQAGVEIDGLARRLQVQYPDTNARRGFRVQSATEFFIGDETAEYVMMLFWSVIFVLLIACGNVANLQYARASGRAREIALRTALGASRVRLIGQIVLESVTLSVVAAIAGIGIAKWGLDLIRGGMPSRVGRYVLGWDQIHLDLRTFAFMFAAAIVSGIVAGLAPALHSSRPNLNESLREGGRGSAGGRARQRLRSFLVGAEIAIAVLLLIGAGLMVHGFQSLVAGAQTIEPASLLALRLSLGETKYRTDAQRLAYYQEVVRRIQALPGVRSAVAVYALPYSQHAMGRAITIEGRPVERGDIPSCNMQPASANYFQTMHIPLRAGRLLRDGDGQDAPRVGVVSEHMARRFWPNQSPIGKRLKLAAPNEPASSEPWITIVGVVGDVTHEVFDRNPRSELYMTMAQFPRATMDIAARTVGDPLRVAPAVTAAVRSIDPEQPIYRLDSMESWMHEDAIALDYMAVLMGIFGGLALVLSSVGVYGVMAYVVSEQTPEIGVRMALGAARSSVLAMVFRRGMTTAIAGLIVGMAAGVGLAHLLSNLVYGVSESDPATFVGIPLTLLGAAALAIFIPARRAMRVDPIIALRYE